MEQSAWSKKTDQGRYFSSRCAMLSAIAVTLVTPDACQYNIKNAI
jgi:hypothetical protein